MSCIQSWAMPSGAGCQGVGWSTCSDDHETGVVVLGPGLCRHLIARGVEVELDASTMNGESGVDAHTIELVHFHKHSVIR